MTSFHASAQNIRVDDGHILRARLQNANGQEVDAEVDLNQFIGNNNGTWTTSNGAWQKRHQLMCPNSQAASSGMA